MDISDTVHDIKNDLQLILCGKEVEKTVFAIVKKLDDIVDSINKPLEITKEIVEKNGVSVLEYDIEEA